MPDGGIPPDYDDTNDEYSDDGLSQSEIQDLIAQSLKGVEASDPASVRAFWQFYGHETDICIAWVAHVMQTYSSVDLLGPALLYGFAFAHSLQDQGDPQPWAAVEDGMSSKFWKSERRSRFRACVVETRRMQIDPFFPSPAVVAGDGLPLSDYTNAVALVAEYGENLHYCYRWGKWLTWTGKHWEVDENGVVMRYAKETVKRLARCIEGKGDDETKELLRHIRKSLNTGSLEAMVRSAQSEKGIAVKPEALDKNPWLLNVANGTLDLLTGTLEAHKRSDLITRCINIEYDADAKCPMWEAFLNHVLAGNAELTEFLQRAIGYSLTGSPREHVMFILWGDGRNGKNTLLDTIATLLDTYAVKVPPDILMASRSERHPTERADLAGKRFVSVSETKQGRRLDESFVKESTGDKKMSARRMREDFWTFDVTHKTWLATNHKPIIKGTDSGIWERIRLVPFTVHIPPEKRDKALLEKLEQELPGILAWAVRGCLAWQMTGLTEPEGVKQATEAYRADMDILGQFITDYCLTGNSACRAKATDLYESYKKWCGETGEQSVSQKAFGTALTERGFERGPIKGRISYIGIALKPVTDPRGDDRTNNRHPTESIEKKEDTDEGTERGDDRRPFFRMNKLRFSRVGDEPEKGHSSSPHSPEMAEAGEKSVISAGRGLPNNADNHHPSEPGGGCPDCGSDALVRDALGLEMCVSCRWTSKQT